MHHEVHGPGGRTPKIEPIPKNSNPGTRTFQNLCRNFVRVLSRLSSGRLLICGTNAFAPACRLLSARGDTIREFPAVGMAPFDPAQNSTYLLAQGDLLYSATGK